MCSVCVFFFFFFFCSSRRRHTCWYCAWGSDVCSSDLDLAVIADVTLPLQPGLNVLTGETGAGKSMLVDALAMLLGERASGDVVRPGAAKTIVEGVFSLSASPLSQAVTALGIEPEDGLVIVKREVLAAG